MNIENRELFDLTIAQKELTLGDFPPEKGDLVNMLGFHAYIKEDCRLDLLEMSWNRILEQNDAIRLRIIRKGLKRKQYIEPYTYEHFNVVKVDGEEGFKQLEKEERKKAVRMINGPLYRVVLVDCGNGAGGMIVCMHNICCDGYSLELVFEQMEEYYALALEGKEFPPFKERSYIEYAKQEKKYMKSKAYKEDCKWWIKKYLSLRHYCIPVGRPSKNVQTDMIISQIQSELYDKLAKFSDEMSCTVTSVIMSAMAISTYKLTKKKSFCFYNLSHGRRTFAMKQTVGCITQANPIFFNINPEKNFLQIAKQDYMEYLEALQHGRVPCLNHVFYGYLETIKMGFNFNDNWMFFSPMGLGELASESKLGLEVFDESELENHFYCALYDVPNESLFRLELNYQIKKFSSKQMERIKENFEAILNWCIEHPETAIKELSI